MPPRPLLACLLLSILPLGGLAATRPALEEPRTELAPPRIKALLEEAWSVEEHAFGAQDEQLAAAIYCEAARFGSAEGHYRAGLIYLRGGPETRDPVSAKSFFYYAHELGHQRVDPLLAGLRDVPIRQPACLTEAEAYRKLARFDFSAYLARLPEARRQAATLIAKLAPSYGVPASFAVAIAAVESNFNARALSPKNAQGIMQLIPATAKRFGVRDPWNPEDNIRGGLAYLKKLMERFAGQAELVAAAYNAGEGAVDRYGGIPPYYETRSYVFRVLGHARSLQTPR